MNYIYKKKWNDQTTCYDHIYETQGNTPKVYDISHAVRFFTMLHLTEDEDFIGTISPIDDYIIDTIVIAGTDLLDYIEERAS